MIGLAQEVPTSMLAQWTPLSDLDFILAHKVLEDKEYAEFFLMRDSSRELILDNSYHELGFALSNSDLLEAAIRCRADYVIAPDRVGDCVYNLQQFLQARQVLKGFKIAVVMTGTPSEIIDPKDEKVYREERDQFLYEVRDADMLCCTFKEKHRYDWFVEASMHKMFRRVHLLGVDSLEELDLWRKWSAGRRQYRLSVDTGKALKWALRGKKLDQLDSLRTNVETTRKGLQSDASLHILSVPRKDVTLEVDELFRHNVKVLKLVCR